MHDILYFSFNSSDVYKRFSWRTPDVDSRCLSFFNSSSLPFPSTCHAMLCVYHEWSKTGTGSSKTSSSSVRYSDSEASSVRLTASDTPSKQSQGLGQGQGQGQGIRGFRDGVASESTPYRIAVGTYEPSGKSPSVLRSYVRWTSFLPSMLPPFLHSFLPFSLPSFLPSMFHLSNNWCYTISAIELILDSSLSVITTLRKCSKMLLLFHIS